MKRLRVIRVLVQDGPEEWVKATLDARMVLENGPRFLIGSDRSIKEMSIWCDAYESPSSLPGIKGGVA